MVYPLLRKNDKVGRVAAKWEFHILGDIFQNTATLIIRIFKQETINIHIQAFVNPHLI